MHINTSNQIEALIQFFKLIIPRSIFLNEFNLNQTR